MVCGSVLRPVRSRNASATECGSHRNGRATSQWTSFRVFVRKSDRECREDDAVVSWTDPHESPKADGSSVVSKRLFKSSKIQTPSQLGTGVDCGCVSQVT